MNPQPDQAEMNSTKAFYNRISKAYDLIADSSEHAARESGITMLAASAGESVLVVGFGTGHDVVTLGRAVSPGGRVYGIDISEGMAEVAQKRVADEGVTESVELSIGDARDLSFADEQFDAVFISFTLELFDDTDLPRVLSEIRRVLRVGGRVGVVSMLKEEEQTLMTEFYILMHRHFPHFVDCHPIDVDRRLVDGGFQIEKLDRVSIWGLPVAIVLARKTK